MDPVSKNLRTAPIICGGIYKKMVYQGDNEPAAEFRGQIVATRTLKDGRVSGELQTYRARIEVVTENSETFDGWELVALPRDLETPLGPERLMAENERLRKEAEDLRRQLAQQEQEEAITRILKLRDEQEMTWGEIGRTLDMHHNTAKSIYLKAKQDAA